MAGIVASKVRKQRALKENKEGDEEMKKRQIKIPVGPPGARQYPGQGKGRTSRVPAIPSDLDRFSDEEGSGNVILYVGLGMVAVGLVITFVGLGDKGFKTLELKLIGPILVGGGLFFALLRILYCMVPLWGKSCCDRHEESENLLKNEEFVEEHQVITKALHKKGNVFSDHQEQVLIRPRVVRVHNFLPACEEGVENSFRPRLKPARQKLKNVPNGGHMSRDGGDRLSGSSSSVEDGAEAEQIIGGSTRNIRGADIILNSARLFGKQN